MVRATTPKIVDATAVTLSGLCLLHCLALPVIISVLPAAVKGLESEIVHQVLVVLAVPLALSAMMSATRQRLGGLAIGLLAFGSICLALGAFYEPLHDYETLLTVAGAILLSAGHISRWVFRPAAA